MERLREILIHWSEIKKWMVLAAAILMVIVAVLFYGKGNNQTITIEDTGLSDTAQAETVSDNPENEQSDPDETLSLIYVDIDGEVKNPGVYQVEPDTRIFQVIQQAGGLTKNADTSCINQAESVCDGAKIHIPGVDEVAAGSLQTGSRSVGQTEESTAASGIININTATSEELQDLPGIGPAIAARIIDYRAANGSFHSIEDIKNVSGIGEKTYDKLKDHITV